MLHHISVESGTIAIVKIFSAVRLCRSSLQRCTQYGQGLNCEKLAGRGLIFLAARDFDNTKCNLDVV